MFIRITACSLADPLKRAFYTKGFGHFIASILPSVATGWSKSCPVGLPSYWSSAPFHGALNRLLGARSRLYQSSKSRKTLGSTLPPETTQHTDWFWKRFGWASNAARAKAPVGSVFRFANAKN